MNRNNIWIHITLAVVLVVFAAVLGQIDRMRTALRDPAPQIASEPVQWSRAGPQRRRAGLPRRRSWSASGISTELFLRN